MEPNPFPRGGLAGALFWTYAILVLHVVLLLLIGVVIVFFRGVYDYFGWILFGGLALVLLSVFFFLRRLRRDQRRLRDILNEPAFRGRSLELSFLGGVASIRVGQQNEGNSALEQESRSLVESPEAQRAEALARLGQMLDQGQISPEEFSRLKKDLLVKQRRTAH